jgi:hypothetical protein
MVQYAFIFVSPSCHAARCKVHFIMLASPSADGLSRTQAEGGGYLLHSDNSVACSEQIVLNCKRCGDCLILLGLEEYGRSERTNVEYRCGGKLTLANRRNEEAMAIKQLLPENMGIQTATKSHSNFCSQRRQKEALETRSPHVRSYPWTCGCPHSSVAKSRLWHPVELSICKRFRLVLVALVS